MKKEQNKKNKNKKRKETRTKKKSNKMKKEQNRKEKKEIKTRQTRKRKRKKITKRCSHVGVDFSRDATPKIRHCDKSRAPFGFIPFDSVLWFDPFGFIS
jgi:hypothetical protein